MLKRILWSLVAVVLVLAAAAFVLPADYRVARSVTVAAPPESIFPLINDLNRWAAWTVWSERDPAMEITISGGGVGKGAGQRWSSETQGQGELVITDSVPGESITYDLFFPGWDSHSTGRIVLEPEAGGSRVTWSDEGSLGNNPVMRWFGLFFDSMIGGDFQAGLLRLKALAEGDQ